MKRSNRRALDIARYPNMGQEWTEEAKEELTVLFRANVGLQDICDTIKRNPNGVATQLERMGLVQRIYNKESGEIRLYKPVVWESLDKNYGVIDNE